MSLTIVSQSEPSITCVNVGVEHLGEELHHWWLVGILLTELQGQLERAVLKNADKNDKNLHSISSSPDPKMGLAFRAERAPLQLGQDRQEIGTRNESVRTYFMLTLSLLRAITITNTYLKRCLVRAKDNRIPEHYVVLCGSSAHAGRWVLLIFRKCVLLTNQEK